MRRKEEMQGKERASGGVWQWASRKGVFEGAATIKYGFQIPISPCCQVGDAMRYSPGGCFILHKYVQNDGLLPNYLLPNYCLGLVNLRSKIFEEAKSVAVMQSLVNRSRLSMHVIFSDTNRHLSSAGRFKLLHGAVSDRCEQAYDESNWSNQLDGTRATSNQSLESNNSLEKKMSSQEPQPS